MKLSVIIANRNDIPMLGVTIRSGLEELSAIKGGGEIVIIDNSDPEYREAVKAVIPARYLDKEVRLFYQDYPCLFTAREEAARQAKGEYIFCVDSHVIFGHNCLLNAVNFMDKHKYKSKLGFGSIPVNWLCQHIHAAKHDMKFLHGTWGKLYDEKKPISWKGMPWICNREWFLNDLNGYGVLSANRLAWGGGDMYLGLKTWLLGYQNWAIPSRPVIHIGPLPKLARPFYKYRLYRESGEQFATFGWLVAFYALGVHDSYFDRPEIESFLKNRINDQFKSHLPAAKQMAEPDRKWIAERSKCTFYDLDENPPWENADKINNYIDFEPYLRVYKQKFNIAKAIRPEDWYLFQKIVEDYGVESVIEFGCGLSTALWKKMELNTISLETDSIFMAKVILFFEKNSELLGNRNNLVFNHWDNIDPPNNELWNAYQFDLAFVDGIDPRDRQIELAKAAAPIIIVHDGYTKPTPSFINDMLSDWIEIKVNSVRSRLFLK